MIALIAARGGSKRLPGKNIKFFNGMPLICWTISAAQKSELFNHIMILSLTFSKQNTFQNTFQ